MGTARLRMTRVALLPAAFLLVCVLPLATAAPWTLVFLLLPVLAAAWVLRVGVDVDDRGLIVRSLAAARRVPWSEVAGIRVAESGQLWLVTTHGTELRLPVLRGRDLPRLAEVSGGRIPAPGPV
ncbi:PH domain-containing protein [Geodermatophilus sp. DF01-2]|uniref:PH domain-containing protein n=1 Tax=Geodermatophilus sp. DF01-2 TaxID=2559610 RepID=UPI0010740469|nr:PH domain-containing protein [Geodermatophilus sp. DF01_2]TFV55476.1 PH domain-containing protein [Geodermatophilus sp. DF01_2]